ncbi:hypothetical protein SNEBB_000062 [Seison nebaliae]|nr:hypothetical protein SNEBB_000062 [Seison nebaliae]
MSHKYRLKYFNTKGLGEFIRWIFLLANEEFCDIRYTRSAFQNEIIDQCPFEQLPILEVDEKEIICQSKSIGRFLASRFDLYGNNLIEQALIDSIVNQIDEITPFLRKMFENHRLRHDIKELQQNFIEVNGNSILLPLEKWLKKNKNNYFVGHTMTLADIYWASYTELLDFMYLEESYNQFPNLLALKNKIYAIPAINEWRKNWEGHTKKEQEYLFCESQNKCLNKY